MSPRRRAAPAGLLVAGLAGLVLAAAGCASSSRTGSPGPGGTGVDSHAADQTYGSLPSWLPTAAVPVGRVVTTSATDPKLGVQGDTMRVVLPRAGLLVTAVGPAVPEEGRFPIPATTRCEFSVTMARASAPVAIAAAQWSAVDERNVLHRLTLVAAPGAGVPRSVAPGRTVTFDLVGQLPPGSGALIWSPVGGATVGTWDFDVEID